MEGETTHGCSLDAVSPLNVSRASEPDQVSTIFREVLWELPYYNERAKTGELQKYTPGKLRASALADPDAILVARVGEELAGFLFNHVDDELVWLSWFGVLPKYRGRGIGSALLLALDERVKHAGYHKIWCDSRTSNEKSKSTLMQHGYVQICTLRDHWYRQDFILWEKRVS
jgi:ribosomal protein S18 acetylase RimI-like enzyme